MLKKGINLINDYSLSGLGTFKNEILEELKNSKYKDLEDLVYRFQLTYDEIIEILDLNYIPTTIKGYTLPPGIYKISDISLMFKSLLSKDVKVKIKIAEVRPETNLTTSKTIRFTKKTFFLYIYRFYSIPFR